MEYPSDLTDERWPLLEPVFKAPDKQGRKHADDLRTVVDAMLYIARVVADTASRYAGVGWDDKP
jgi:putative transposase